MLSNEIMPWFAPALSPEMVRIFHNLGHQVQSERGSEIRVSPIMNRAVYVRSGFVAQAVLNPRSRSPFMITLSGPGSFGMYSYMLDYLPRRYWAVTHAGLLTVNEVILEKLAGIESSWAGELHSYNLRKAAAERLGLMICQAADTEKRFGVFLCALYLASGGSVREMENPSGAWARLPSVPSRRLVASAVCSTTRSLDRIIIGMVKDGSVRHSDGALLVRSQVMAEHWQWLKPFLQQQNEEAAMEQPMQEIIRDGDLYEGFSR